MPYVPFCGLPTEARDHAFVDLARHADVVEIVFTNLIEFARLIQVKHLASLDVRRLARLNSERSGNVVKTDVALCAQPPAMHRVEDAADVVLTKIHKRPRLDRMREAALEDKR